MKKSISAEKRLKIRSLSGAPDQSWPTLLLFLCSFSAWIGANSAAANGAFPLATLFLVATASQVLLFTCMHEASHGVAARGRDWNYAVGFLSSFSLYAPYTGFRYVHHLHHAHTNKGVEDPDLYSSGQGWKLFFRCATQDLYYYWVFLRDIRKHTLLTNLSAFAQMGMILGITAWLWNSGHANLFWFGWFLPVRVAYAWLSFAFNFLPHHPHEKGHPVDTCARPGMVAAVLLQGQNLHNVHHLYPTVRFYKYGKVWALVEEESKAAGAVVRPARFGLR